MLRNVFAIPAISYAAQVTIALIVIFFVVFPLLVNALLGVAAGIAKGEQRDNDAYEENITARR
jgi:hypothetical protein